MIDLIFMWKKKKKNVNACANELGVSPKTVLQYIKEINEDPDYYQEIVDERIAWANNPKAKGKLNRVVDFFFKEKN